MKIALVMCNDMHADLEKANLLLSRISHGDIVTDYTIADTVIVYACAFGKFKSYSVKVIADVRIHAKPNATVIVTGCLAQLCYEDLIGIPGIQVQSFDRLLASFDQIESMHKVIRQNTIIISEGCCHRCTYCVYPQFCGIYKSKPIEQILEEIRDIYDTESTICISGAQETSDYGIDLYHYQAFPQLMKKILDEFPKSQFVIGWFHPSGLSNDLVQTIIEHKNISEIMLHIQHNDSEILKAMNRQYQIEDITTKLERIKQSRPDLIISTEIIVGFPGETDEKFSSLVDYLSRGYFDDIAVASYEKVEGTKAAKMTNQVPKEVAHKRMEIIHEKFNATCYEAPNAEEESETIIDTYLQAYYMLKNMPNKMLTDETMQKYSLIAGVDTLEKFNFDGEFEKIISIISNSRDELACTRAKRILASTYTKEVLEIAYRIIQESDLKPGFKSRAQKILIE